MIAAHNDVRQEVTHFAMTGHESRAGYYSSHLAYAVKTQLKETRLWFHY